MASVKVKFRPSTVARQQKGIAALKASQGGDTPKYSGPQQKWITTENLLLQSKGCVTT